MAIFQNAQLYRFSSWFWETKNVLAQDWHNETFLFQPTSVRVTSGHKQRCSGQRFDKTSNTRVTRSTLVSKSQRRSGSTAGVSTSAQEDILVHGGSSKTREKQGVEVGCLQSFVE